MADVFFLIVGLVAIGMALTGGRLGLFRPDLSLSGAADLLGLVATVLLTWLVTFDFPEGASREIGVFLAFDRSDGRRRRSRRLRAAARRTLVPENHPGGWYANEVGDIHQHRGPCSLATASSGRARIVVKSRSPRTPTVALPSGAEQKHDMKFPRVAEAAVREQTAGTLGRSCGASPKLSEALRDGIRVRDAPPRPSE